MSRHLRNYLDFDCADIVEVEVTDSVITKRVIRFPIGDGLALVMVVSGEGRVITVWANRDDDDHSSLDTSRFVKPRRAVCHREVAEALH